MDEQQQRISEDLAGLFSGTLRFDDVAREIYSTDASIYQIRPLGVAYPRHRDDVVTLAQYARDCDLPVIARGAGSGVAGGALGRGLIIDFSRYMNAIESVEADTVRVQAGVVRDQLNAVLREYGRYFAPDPSNTAVTTMGGMLAVDAAGSHAVRVGSTRDHVKSIETVLADGTIFEAERHHRHGNPMAGRRQNEIVSRVAQLIAQNRDLIRERQPGLPRNASGYHLRTILEGDWVNLPRLLVGSEGTLALFTAATLHTLALPAHRGAALVLFHDMEKAVEAVQAVSELVPSACDLLDRRLLSLAREADSRFAITIPANAEAAILIEQSGYSDRQVRSQVQDLLAAVREVDSTAILGQEGYSFEEVEFLWSLPYRVVPLLNRLRGETRPTPLIEDIAVPPAALRDFLVKAHTVFQKHWVTASLYAHAASGQTHFRPFLSIPSQANSAKIEGLARELYEVAIACGGTISGEHGNGLARTAFIRSQYGPLYRVFQQLKEIFDPHNLLNPGKIVSDDPHLTIRNFRSQPEDGTADSPLVPLQLHWEPGEFNETALRCNGCGDCRVQQEPLRMCPFFHVDQVEEAAPRSKANLMRGLATGQIDSRTFSTEQAKELADQCFNCKQCELECPSNVNIPSLAIEAKAQCVAANGLSRADWFLSRAHSFGGWGCRFSPIANRVIRNRYTRWLIEKTFGISRHRKLPKFAPRPFLKTIKETDAQRKSSEVVYFVDYFANYHDHVLAKSLIRILEHHDIPVSVPPDQVASGMAMICAGDLDAARELAEINVRILAEHAREGKPILCTEPTAAVCLKYEYPRLIDHPDVQLVAEQAVEAGAYLQSLNEQGRLISEFTELPLSLGYHTPCHLKALAEASPLAALLEQIPGVELQRIEKGCSGMAGAFGLTAKNFEKSVAMGSELITTMKSPPFRTGVTECSSCRMQMQQGATVPTIHPLKILAFAYGLMPELKKQLAAEQ